MEKLKQLNKELQTIQERLERTDFDVSEKLQNIIDDISNLVEARVSPTEPSIEGFVKFMKEQKNLDPDILRLLNEFDEMTGEKEPTKKRF